MAKRQPTHVPTSYILFTANFSTFVSFISFLTWQSDRVLTSFFLDYGPFPMFSFNNLAQKWCVCVFCRPTHWQLFSTIRDNISLCTSKHGKTTRQMYIDGCVRQLRFVFVALSFGYGSYSLTRAYAKQAALTNISCIFEDLNKWKYILSWSLTEF